MLIYSVLWVFDLCSKAQCLEALGCRVGGLDRAELVEAMKFILQVSIRDIKQALLDAMAHFQSIEGGAIQFEDDVFDGVFYKLKLRYMIFRTLLSDFKKYESDVIEIGGGDSCNTWENL